MNGKKNILITPLDWGLGHATRCIPLIRYLYNRNCNIIVAGYGSSLNVIRNEFPSLTWVQLPAYNPMYSSSSSQVWIMAKQLFKFIHAIWREHVQMKMLVEKHKIDIIISDNRFGCRHKNVENIFITHQLSIQMPQGLRWMQALVNFVNQQMIKQFDHCWIPDNRTINLTGKLSSCRSPIKVQHIGILSRFSSPTATEKKYKVAVLLSGPEPQRSILEEIMVQQLKVYNKKTIVIRGACDSKRYQTSDQIAFIDFPGTLELQLILSQAEIVIARSGYSTIMDLIKLKSRAIFIPTPGQTEQEYLAKRLQQKKIAGYMHQHRFDLQTALAQTAKYTGFGTFTMQDEFQPFLDQVLT